MAALLCAGALLPVGASAAEQSGVPAAGWAGFVEPDFPFFSSVLDARRLGGGFPARNLTPRGIILNLGNNAWACFDTELLRMSAIWIGEGVTPVSMSQGSYHVSGAKAPQGQRTLPRIAGTPWMATANYPGWQAGPELRLEDPRSPGPDPREAGRGPMARQSGGFHALQLTGSGVRLDYEAAGTAISEWVESRQGNGNTIIQRRFHLENVPAPLWLILGNLPETAGDIGLAIAATTLAGSSEPAAELVERDGVWAVRVSSTTGPVRFCVAAGVKPDVEAWNLDAAALEVPAAARWRQEVITSGTAGPSQTAVAVDNINLPLGNPWRRNVRFADLAFLSDGRAAAVTFDGDVWMIDGLGENLERIAWKRFASGLHEPLGIAVRNDEIFVHDRNGVWRLRDTNGSGEADRHELFSNGFTQTAETREFAMGLEAAPDGSFVIAKGGQQGSSLGQHNGTVLRISADGVTTDVLGWGLRQPFIGVHPRTGLVTASDQQGNYVPATPLHRIGEARYYGFLTDLHPREQYPAPIAEPLAWIPHSVNASGAGQVWLAGARMGSLDERLILIGYYRPEIFLVLLNERLPRLQAAVTSLTRDFKFGPLNGALNPRDGLLYVIGFQIWGTQAPQISGLARIRPGEAALALPREIAPRDQGVLLRFDAALDEAKALNSANYSASRWNYRRTASYGSPHFKLDGSTGQDTLTPSSVYLSRDRKSVFVGIPGMRPVMQMRLGWSLAPAGREGVAMEQEAFFTPQELIPFDPAAEGFDPLIVELTVKAPGVAEDQPVAASVAEGSRVAELMGCIACHSVDGSTLGKSGPTWKGLFGSRRNLVDGTTPVADEAYVRRSILDPGATRLREFEGSDAGMPSYQGILSDTQIDSLILYIRTLQ